jgi:hypothetical protein
MDHHPPEPELSFRARLEPGRGAEVNARARSRLSSAAPARARVSLALRRRWWWETLMTLRQSTAELTIPRSGYVFYLTRTT